MKKFFAILLSAALLVSMFVVFAPAAEATNVAAGKSVTYSVKQEPLVSSSSGAVFADVLTDGKTSDTINGYDGSWWAFQGYWNCETDIDNDQVADIGYAEIDLGAATAISAVKVHLGNGVSQNPNDEYTSVTAKAPASVKLYVDGTEIGSFTTQAEDGAYWASLDNLTVTGQKVKVEFTLGTATNGIYALIDEIEIYDAVAEESSSSSVASSEVSSDVSSEVSSDVSSEVSSDVSSEVSSDVSSEVSSDVSSEESSAPAESLEDQLAGLVGEDNAESMFDMVINAPETYVPGESITVEVTIANVQAIVKEGGAADGADMYLHLVEGQLFYDNEFLTLTNTVEEGVLLALEEVKGFEDWCKIKADNQIEVSALTEKTSASYSKKDGELVFKFTFDVSADATGDLGFYITSESVWGSSNAADGNAYGTTKVVGNGSYAIISEYVEEESSSSSSSSSVVESSSSAVESSSSVAESTEAPTPVEPGDASVGFVVFAILAVVAIAGSAVVIKSRR